MEVGVVVAGVDGVVVVVEVWGLEGHWLWSPTTTKMERENELSDKMGEMLIFFVLILSFIFKKEMKMNEKCVLNLLSDSLTKLHQLHASIFSE